MLHAQLGRSAVEIFAANERMNQLLIEHLDVAAWRARPPGKARPIVAIFTHVHNVRTKWVRLTAPHLTVPAQLNRARCTPEQASAGLAESAARCEEMLAEALGGEGRIVEFRRDGWARPWPVGAGSCATWLLMKLTIAGRCACWRVRWGFRSLMR